MIVKFFEIWVNVSKKVLIEKLKYVTGMLTLILISRSNNIVIMFLWFFMSVEGIVEVIVIGDLEGIFMFERFVVLF